MTTPLFSRCPRRRSRRALTLVELLVVLTILVVVAGIAANAFPGLVNRANNTAWLSNLKEVDRAIIGYHAANRGQYPDGFDSLVNSTGALYTGLPGGAAGGLSTNVLEARPPTSAELSKLNLAGITTAQGLKDDHTSGFGATYFAYVDGPGGYDNPFAIDTTTPIAFLQRNGSGTYLFAGQKMRLEDDHTYAIFGVGQACGLVGPSSWLKDTPVIVHNNGCLDPSVTYGRVGIIFDLGDPTSSPFSPALYVGSVVFSPSGFRYSDEMLNIPERFE